MALWLFIQCRVCGYSGCAAPIGDRCPSCNQVLEPDPVPNPEPATS